MSNESETELKRKGALIRSTLNAIAQKQKAMENNFRRLRHVAIYYELGIDPSNGVSTQIRRHRKNGAKAIDCDICSKDPKDRDVDRAIAAMTATAKRKFLHKNKDVLIFSCVARDKQTKKEAVFQSCTPCLLRLSPFIKDEINRRQVMATNGEL